MFSDKKQQGNTLTIFMLFLIALVVVALLMAVFAFKIGYNSAQKNVEVESDLVINGELVNGEMIENFQKQNEQFKLEADIAKKERDISLTNISSMRKDIDDLRVTNLQLNNTMEAFANNIAKQGGMPLKILAAKIEPLPENAYDYKFDVAMVSKDGKVKTLRPTIKLLNETSFVNIPLSPSTYDIKGVSYIRGRFVMPEGFEPRQIKLTLEAGGQSISQLYNWRFGKPTNSPAISLNDVPDVDKRPIEQ